MTVGEIETKMSAREIAEWMALASIEYDERLQGELKDKAAAGLAAKKAGRARR